MEKLKTKLTKPKLYPGTNTNITAGDRFIK